MKDLIMIKDTKYWAKYYKTHQNPFNPSLFASFCLNYFKENASILELGCGNGRDAVFLSKKGFRVKALDLCKEEIDFLNHHYKNENLEFKCCDFCDFVDTYKYDAIYSRFTLHSVNKKSQDNLFSNLNKLLNDNGILCIEVRGKKNSLFGKGESAEKDAFIYENHYRRFLDFEDLKKDLKNLGFEILYAKEDINFAPFKDENDSFIRLVAKKI